MWVFKALSALLFLIGSMTLVVATVGLWFYAGMHLIMVFGWFAAAIYIVGSVLAVVRWENYLKLPFLLWFQLWQYADRMILDRRR